jgi:hypothetical protein
MSDATREERTDETEESTAETDDEHDHLDGIEDGCGCTEVWEHLSEQRNDEEAGSRSAANPTESNDD